MHQRFALICNGFSSLLLNQGKGQYGPWLSLQLPKCPAEISNPATHRAACQGGQKRILLDIIPTVMAQQGTVGLVKQRLVQQPSLDVDNSYPVSTPDLFSYNPDLVIATYSV